jgi:PilZ domain-containing protein
VDSERRRYDRYAIRLRVVMRLGLERKRVRGTIMDLSRGGMFLQTRHPLRLAQPVEVRFRAHPNMECTATGRVARVFEAKMLRGFGVSFDRTNDTFEKLLTLVERLRPEIRAQFLLEVMEKELEIIPLG